MKNSVMILFAAFAAWMVFVGLSFFFFFFLSWVVADLKRDIERRSGQIILKLDEQP